MRLDVGRRPPTQADPGRPGPTRAPAGDIPRARGQSVPARDIPRLRGQDFRTRRRRSSPLGRFCPRREGFVPDRANRTRRRRTSPPGELSPRPRRPHPSASRASGGRYRCSVIERRRRLLDAVTGSMSPMSVPTYLLVDGENIDATLGMSVLGRRPDECRAASCASTSADARRHRPTRAAPGRHGPRPGTFRAPGDSPSRPGTSHACGDRISAPDGVDRPRREGFVPDRADRTRRRHRHGETGIGAVSSSVAGGYWTP